MSSPDAQPDFTKTRKYAITDLIIKAISAAAVVVIGVATYLYQSHSEDRRNATADQEKKAQLLLPFLRSSSEVGAVLDEVSTRYSYPSGDDSEAREKAELGGRLAYVAASLQFPGTEPDFDLVPAADIIADSAAPRHVSVPARSALLFLGDLLRFAPLFNDELQKKSVVDFKGQQLRFVRPNGSIKAVTVGDRSGRAWAAWMPPAPVKAEEIYDVDLPTLADLLAEQLARRNDGVVLANRDLAKEYVAIRSDVIRNRSDLVPSRHAPSD